MCSRVRVSYFFYLSSFRCLTTSSEESAKLLFSMWVAHKFVPTLFGLKFQTLVNPTLAVTLLLWDTLIGLFIMVYYLLVLIESTEKLSVWICNNVSSALFLSATGTWTHLNLCAKNIQYECANNWLGVNTSTFFRLIDLRPTPHRIGNFRDVFPGQSLGLILKSFVLKKCRVIFFWHNAANWQCMRRVT